jgi:putative SOS response-associated peptidase YedK
MCAHFESVKDAPRLRQYFQVDLPERVNFDVWPTYSSTFIRHVAPEILTSQPDQPFEAMSGSFGLIPHWSKDTKIARQTYNARLETIDQKPAYKDAWRLGRVCIIPAEAIFEPDWRSGKAVLTRISRADSKPMGIAGIWTGWRSSTGEILRSFSMITLNADEHPFMRNFHKPEEEKRMVAILDDEYYTPWIKSRGEECLTYLKAFAAHRLIATT